MDINPVQWANTFLNRSRELGRVAIGQDELGEQLIAENRQQARQVDEAIDKALKKVGPDALTAASIWANELFWAIEYGEPVEPALLELVGILIQLPEDTSFEDMGLGANKAAVLNEFFNLLELQAQE
jgi:hypothetical protein